MRGPGRRGNHCRRFSDEVDTEIQRDCKVRTVCRTSSLPPRKRAAKSCTIFGFATSRTICVALSTVQNAW